jgi:deoxyribonuclease-4
MLPDGRRIGAHLPLGHGMLKAADRAIETGATALQVFGDNPTAWRRRSEPPAELPAFCARLEAGGLLPIAIHGPYLLNLASPDEVVRERSVDLLANELRVAPRFGARYLNVHLGSHRGSGLDAGIERIGASIAAALAMVGPAPDGTLLVLENSAGGGDSLGSTVDELARIATSVEDHGVDPSRFAFCLDTAHAWGAGLPIGDPAGVDEVLALLDRRIGLDRVVMVHLNDSRAGAGSRADRHEHLGAGMVGVAGLRRILTHPDLQHATYILETPGMEEGYDAVNLARAVAIAEGRPLEPLPAAAFRVRGGRRGAAPPDETAT